ncbi:hypothetical protein QUF80_09905 [Desulfococcaceae bacterium HSG8]|nr:hypothetical protein [Desulfococcaceae bacterium HSG8]
MSIREEFEKREKSFISPFGCQIVVSRAVQEQSLDARSGQLSK